MSIASSMTPDSKATKVMTRQGFKQVKIIDRDPWLAAVKGCTIPGMTLFTLKGVNSAGKEVTRYVCAAPWMEVGTLRPR